LSWEETIIEGGDAPGFAVRARGTGESLRQLLVSSAAGTKAGRQEKRAARANYGELLKDFSSMCT